MAAANDTSRLTSGQKRKLLRDLLKRAAPIPVHPLQESYPLSSSQRRMWFLHQLEPESGRYHVIHAVRILGPFEAHVFDGALNDVIRRHEALRTTFRFDGAEPVQSVAPALTVNLSITNLSRLDPAERETQADRTLTSESARPFDLEKGPLVRAGVIRIADEVHILYVVMHHIISDGWSLRIFLRELTAFAVVNETRETPDLPKVTHQYKDYALWQLRQMNTPVLEKALDYWRASLSSAQPLLRLPLDRPRPERLSDRGGRIHFSIPVGTARRFREFCAGEGVTLYAGLLAAFQVLLYRYSGDEIVVTGFPIACRQRREWENVIGFFSNTVAMATPLSSGEPFRDLLKAVSNRLIEALANQDLPFELLVESLRPSRSLSHHPIFQAVLLLEEEASETVLGRLRVTPVPVDTGFTKFDLTFALQSGDSEALGGYAEYSTDIFDRSTIDRMGRHYAELLASIVHNPDCAVAALPMILPEEKKTLLGDWNATQRDYPRDTSLHCLFESQVQCSPDSLAIISGESRITYAELNSAANRLARRLVSAGAEPGTRVGIALNQSPEVIAAILATLKTGCAYIPLDPIHPAERNRDLLHDCGADLVITLRDHFAELDTPGVRLLAVDDPSGSESADNLTWEGSGSDIAYIMYTSGSTGRPKGVIVPHRGVSRLVLNTDYVAIGCSDRVAQVSTFLFDASTFEIFGALLNGAAMVMISRETALSPLDFSNAIASQEVTVAFLTSSLFNHLASAAPHAFHPFRYVLVGGEAVDPKWFAQVFRSGYAGRLVNAYGPTEGTTFSICNVLSSWTNELAAVPIGRPVANTTAYVLDRDLQPVPPGVVGEICIGGDGLAVGYINDEINTRDRFVANPFAPGTRLYRTGDLGRCRPTGEIEYIGRADRQLKIRGFRIEPAEVERAVESHPAVTHAAVIATGGDSASRTLSAYVVLAPGESLSGSVIREWLKTRLPAYLVPSRVIVMDAFPLTSNGKLDHSRLPADFSPERKAPITRVPTPMESFVLGTWQSILGVDQLAPEDNFFDAGGTSLLAMRMLSDLQTSLARRIPVALILRSRTAQEFANALELRAGGKSSNLFCLREGNPRLAPVVLVHAGFDFIHVLRSLTIQNPVWTLSLPTREHLADAPNMQRIASIYTDELRQAFPASSPILVGYCLAGMIGFEIARQLSGHSQEPGSVVLLDVPSPRYYWARSWVKSLAGIGPYLKYHGKRLRGLPPAERTALLRTWIRRLRGASPDSDSTWELHEEIGACILHAARSYNPEPYSGKVVLLRASSWPEDHKYLGWTPFAGSVEVHETPATHEDIFKPPYAHRIAAVLAAAAEPRDVATPI